MKPSKKIMLLTSCVLAIFALAACGSNQKQSKEKQASSTVQKSSSDKEHYKGSYSNLNSKASVKEVRALLSAYLDQDSVDKFLGLVTDYDSIVGSVGLTGDFSKFKKTDYNVEKISDLWTKKKGDFVGTNCRINSYTLLKNRIEIPKMKADSELLFVDNDAIDKGKFFDEADKEDFNILYSRVPTEATTDVKVHAKKMEEYFAHFKFNENARMLSVIVHDNLDGNTLFVGHVGKLIKVAGGVGNTHSKYGDRRMEIMWDCARIHCEEMAESDRNRLKDQVLASNTTEEAVIWLEKAGVLKPAMMTAVERMKQYVEEWSGRTVCAEVVTFTNGYGILGMTCGAENMIEAFRIREEANEMQKE